MKQKTKFKETEIGKYLLLLFLIMLIIPIASAYRDIGINIKIQPRGVISKDYFVVGDIFIYNITLTNRFNETINDTFTIRIVFPDNQTISNPALFYYRSIKPNETKSIVPYIKGTNNNTHIWPFMTSGDYKLEICSQNKDIRFIKNYEVPLNSYSHEASNYYFYNCFPYYFSAMPKWKYQIFMKGKVAAEASNEASDKLVGLTKDLDNATWALIVATIIMLFVTIITLYVAIAEEKDKKEGIYKIIKWISKRITLMIFFALVIYLFFIILLFFKLII